MFWLVSSSSIPSSQVVVTQFPYWCITIYQVIIYKSYHINRYSLFRLVDLNYMIHANWQATLFKVIFVDTRDSKSLSFIQLKIFLKTHFANSPSPISLRPQLVFIPLSVNVFYKRIHITQSLVFMRNTNHNSLPMPFILFSLYTNHHWLSTESNK